MTKEGDLEKLLYESEVFQIRGAVFDVHNEMGVGFLEAVYQECLAQESMRAGYLSPRSGHCR